MWATLTFAWLLLGVHLGSVWGRAVGCVCFLDGYLGLSTVVLHDNNSKDRKVRRGGGGAQTSD